MRKIFGTILAVTIMAALAYGSALSPESIKLNPKWAPISVFFGVNNAWSLSGHSKVTLTYLARDQMQPFIMSKFLKQDYAQSLSEIRQIGLSPVGVKDWKIETISFHEITRESLLVKVWGHYSRGDKRVAFYEWQHFTPEYYGQVSLISGPSESTDPIKDEEREELFKKVLKL